MKTMNVSKNILTQTLVGALLIAFTACASPEGKFKEKDDIKSEIVVIEAENMDLTSAEIITEKGASGGKAIKMLSEEAMAGMELTLPEGQYAMNASIKTSDEMSDGFYLVVDDKVRRTNNYHFNQWVYGFKFIIFDSDGKNPVTIQIASTWEGQKGKEFGMLIDYLEIVELCNSASVLERWTK